MRPLEVGGPVGSTLRADGAGASGLEGRRGQRPAGGAWACSSLHLHRNKGGGGDFSGMAQGSCWSLALEGPARVSPQKDSGEGIQARQSGQ